MNRALRQLLREKPGREPEPSAGIGGEQRGFDGGKKVRGCKRLLEPVRSRLPRLSYLWMDAGYRGRGNEWAERELGVKVEVVNRTPKPPPEKVLRIWAKEWFREGNHMDLGKLPKRPSFENLPRRWVAERTFAWISHNRRMSRDHERLCSTGEVFIHAAMTRLMVKMARAYHSHMALWGVPLGR
jgi:transposase